MSYRIFLSKQADKFLQSLENKWKARIEELLTILIENPLPYENYALKKLKGRKKTYMIRLGELRVVYELFIDNEEINILKINWRETVYKIN